MMAETRMYWLHALTPVHVGSGFGLGFIDLPIMREKATNWPVVPGSAVKGVLADHHKASKENREGDAKLRAAFGSGGDDSANAGALVFSDARLVCLPVRSLYGTFSWVTSKLMLQRLKRDLDAANASTGLPEPPESKDKAFVAQASALSPEGTAYLGDLNFAADSTNADAQKWATALAKAVFPGDEAWQKEFVARFAILPDNSFDYFSETGTEVAAHIAIDAQLKTVDKKQGGLWYEESLPAETVLAGIVWCDSVFGTKDVTREQVFAYARSQTGEIQIGGKATVGKGRVRFITAAAKGAGQ